MAVRKYIDIGANLTDSMFNGFYNGSKKHEPDLIDVLDRAWKQGVEKIIITGGSLNDTKEALALANSDERLFVTVGCHPTRCDEFENSGDPEDYLDGLSKLVEAGESKVIAVGECGLDYGRLHFCSKHVQLKYFEQQLTISKDFNIPLFLHCRNAADDLINILVKHGGLPGGVVHSFDGSLEEAKRIINLGFYIGINGCSLKTQQNLDVIKEIPSSKLMVETDCPWCEIKPSHSGSKFVTTKFPSAKKEKWQKGIMIKGRNEPANIVQVLEILSSVKNENIDTLSAQIYENTLEVFFRNRGKS